MKTELEDLAFASCTRRVRDVSQRVAKKHLEQGEYLAEVQQLIQSTLRRGEVPRTSRPRQALLRIWSKMQARNPVRPSTTSSPSA